jgi:hypothetical protein
MKTEIFTLCDAATEQQGKMNLLGSFDHLWARQEPISHPGCALALKLRFSKIEEGDHKIKITFGNEDGQLIMPPLEAPVVVRVAPGESTSIAHLVLNMQQLKLPKFGEYSIDLAVDGRAESSLPLYVRKIEDPNAKRV